MYLALFENNNLFVFTMQLNDSIEAEIKALRFYLTPAHDCHYLPDKQSMSIFVDPQYKMTNSLYSHLSTIGFRRSGQHVYRPHCPECRACLPLRVPTADFLPNRSQRRILKSNTHLEMRIQRASFDDEHYRLYRRYMNWRHAGGDMDTDDPEAYHSLFASAWSETWMYCFYDKAKPVAVAITDHLDNGLSAVYTFYEPELISQGLGTYAVLCQIQQAHEDKIPYVYLGYWIEACNKMAYKSRFKPYQFFTGSQWKNDRL